MKKEFIFRTILPEEADQAVKIEQICFPPNEACAPADMMRRTENVSDLFLVAVDPQIGRIAGFLNGMSTNETAFRDAFFRDTSLYQPDGENIMLLGLDVLPEYRRQGLASELVKRYAAREAARGRKRLILTCLESRIGMYRKMGFSDLGLSASSWGGEKWHEMVYDLQPLLPGESKTF